MTEQRRTLTLMGEQLMLASQKIAAAKGVSPLPAPAPESAPPPHTPDPPPRYDIRNRLMEERRGYEAMDDEELAFEFASLSENVESLKLELTLYYQGETKDEHPPGWQVRAQRALTALKGRLALCKLEKDHRRRADEEYRAEQERRDKEQKRIAHLEFLREGQERKLARIAAANEQDYKKFVDQARMILPPETFTQIWAAVHADGGS